MTLPAYAYQDPAKVVEQDDLREQGCRACESHRCVLGRVVCTDPRMTKPSKVPGIGSKCKYFKLLEI